MRIRWDSSLAILHFSSKKPLKIPKNGKYIHKNRTLVLCDIRCDISEKMMPNYEMQYLVIITRNINKIFHLQSWFSGITKSRKS